MITENIQLCKSMEDAEHQNQKLRESHAMMDKVTNKVREQDKWKCFVSENHSRHFIILCCSVYRIRFLRMRRQILP